jgi:hypothetical protein
MVNRRDPKRNAMYRACICNLLRSPGIDSEESVPPGLGWESILGLFKSFTNAGSVNNNVFHMQD